MFGFFKKKETVAERNKDKDHWAQIAQSHGWLLDQIDDDDPWFKTYWLEKDITVKAWAYLLAEGRPHWSKISMRMSISNLGVVINHNSTILGSGATKTWRENCAGSDLKDFEEDLLEDAESLPVLEYLKISQEEYQERVSRGELRSVVSEARIEMLKLIKAN